MTAFTKIARATLTLLVLVLVSRARGSQKLFSSLRKHSYYSSVSIRSASMSVVIFASSVQSEVPLSWAVSDSSPVQTTSLVVSANLPQSNGATGAQRGTPEALKPILEMRSVLDRALRAASTTTDGSLEEVSSLLKTLPTTEKSFKKMFDEYSEGISYRQNYKDKNAFVVYYTRGFDGVGRDSIETPTASESKQTEQFYYRNEAWIAVDGAIAEAKYLRENPSENRKDLKELLEKAIGAVTAYSVIP